MSNVLSAEDKLTKAKINLTVTSAFFATLVMSLQDREDNNFPTGYTDGRYLGWNREYINNASMEEVRTFLAHEGLHCGFLHFSRRGNRNHELWNTATDHVINLVLKESNFWMDEKKYLCDAKYAGMCAEEVYDLLMKEILQKFKKGKLKMSEDGSGIDISDLIPDEWKEKSKSLGEVRDRKNGDGTKDEKGEVDGKELSPSEQKAEEEKWKVTLSNATNMAKRAGKLSAGLERLIGDILAAKIDWKEQLKIFANSVCKDGYDWKRPNRRFSGSKIYFPRLHNRKINPLAVLVDESGSIDDEQNKIFGGEINSIVAENGVDVYAGYFDTKICKTEFFDHHDGVVLMKPAGGGGTCYVDAFNWVEEELENDVSGTIVLTDGYCDSFPENTPDKEVIWVITPDGNKDFKPPFGEVIRMQKDS